MPFVLLQVAVRRGDVELVAGPELAKQIDGVLPGGDLKFRCPVRILGQQGSERSLFAPVPDIGISAALDEELDDTHKPLSGGVV